MEMNGEYRIAASREKVWAALNDTEILKKSIPGCEEINRLSETEMTATVVAKVGPVKAKFTGQVTLSDLNPPNSYRISGEGKGGAAGFAKARAEAGPRSLSAAPRCKPARGAIDSLYRCRARVSVCCVVTYHGA